MAKNKYLVIGGVAALLGIGVLMMSGDANASEGDETDDDTPAPDYVTPEQIASENASKAAVVRADAAKSEAARAVAFQEAAAASIASGSPDVMRDTASRLESRGYKHGDDLRAVADRVVQAMKDKDAERATPKEMEEAGRTVLVEQIQKLGPELVGPEEAAEEAKDAQDYADELKAKQASRNAQLAAQAEADQAREDAERAREAAEAQDEPDEITATPEPGPPEGAEENTDFRDGQSRAKKLNQHLKATGKGGEDRALVRAFQAVEKLKPDGKYGTTTALEIGSYGIVPARPFYLKSDWVQDKKDYRAGLAALSKQYPDLKTDFALALRRWS